jgi:hypothetical protein
VRELGLLNRRARAELEPGFFFDELNPSSSLGPSLSSLSRAQYLGSCQSSARARARARLNIKRAEPGQARLAQARLVYTPIRK